MSETKNVTLTEEELNLLVTRIISQFNVAKMDIVDSVPMTPEAAGQEIMRHKAPSAKAVYDALHTVDHLSMKFVKARFTGSTFEDTMAGKVPEEMTLYVFKDRVNDDLFDLYIYDSQQGKYIKCGSAGIDIAIGNSQGGIGDPTEFWTKEELDVTAYWRKDEFPKDLYVNVDELNAKLTPYSTKLEEHESAIASLVSNDEGTVAKLAEIEATLAEQETKNQEVANQLVTLDDSIDALSNKVDASNATQDQTIADLSTLVNTNVSRLDNLDAAVNDVRDLADAYKTELDNNLNALTERVNVHDQNFENTRDMITGVQHNLDVAQETMTNDFNNTIGTLKAEFNKKIDDLNALCDKLDKKFDKAVADTNALLAETRETYVKIADLTTYITDYMPSDVIEYWEELRKHHVDPVDPNAKEPETEVTDPDDGRQIEPPGGIEGPSIEGETPVEPQPTEPEPTPVEPTTPDPSEPEVEPTDPDEGKEIEPGIEPGPSIEETGSTEEKKDGNSVDLNVSGEGTLNYNPLTQNPDGTPKDNGSTETETPDPEEGKEVQPGVEPGPEVVEPGVSEGPSI